MIAAWMIDANLACVRRDLAQWLAKRQGKYPKPCALVEDNIEETLTYYRLPLARRTRMKSTNMLESLNPGDQAAHAYGMDLPSAGRSMAGFARSRKLSAAGARAWPARQTRTGSSRPLPQHGASARAQERDFASLGRLTAAGRGHIAPSWILLNLTHPPSLIMRFTRPRARPSCAKPHAPLTKPHTPRARMRGPSRAASPRETFFWHEPLVGLDRWARACPEKVARLFRSGHAPTL
ncbi:MAG: transposase [Methylocella sp.]